MKYFYSDIIEIDTFLSDVSELDISHEEKEALHNLFHSSAHHAVVDSILDILSESDKQEFLKHLAYSSHDTIRDYLKNKVENIEDIIRKTVHSIRDEFHADVKALKAKK